MRRILLPLLVVLLVSLCACANKQPLGKFENNNFTASYPPNFGFELEEGFHMGPPEVKTESIVSTTGTARGNEKRITYDFLKLDVEKGVAAKILKLKVNRIIGAHWTILPIDLSEWICIKKGQVDFLDENYNYCGYIDKQDFYKSFPSPIITRVVLLRKVSDKSEVIFTYTEESKVALWDGETPPTAEQSKEVQRVLDNLKKTVHPLSQ